jgi:hypothetical protein
MMGSVALIVAGCGGDAETLPPPSEWPLEVTLYECPEGGDCSRQFWLGDSLYGLSCRLIREDYVSGTVIGVGAAEMRVVDTVDPQLFVAVHLPGAECHGDQQFPEGPVWLLANGPESDPFSAEQREAGCRVVDHLPGQREADGCAPSITPPG